MPSSSNLELNERVILDGGKGLKPLAFGEQNHLTNGDASFGLDLSLEHAHRDTASVADHDHLACIK